jgi:hypothetical protein
MHLLEWYTTAWLGFMNPAFMAIEDQVRRTTTPPASGFSDHPMEEDLNRGLAGILVFPYLVAKTERSPDPQIIEIRRSTAETSVQAAWQVEAGYTTRRQQQTFRSVNGRN